MPANYIAEPACQQDAPAIAAIMQRSYHTLLRQDYDEDQVAEILPVLAASGPDLVSTGTYFVVRDGQRKLIGAGGWSDIGPTRRIGALGEAYMRDVVVDPDALNQGVGRALLEEAFISAQSFGIKALRCYSTLPAAPFYNAMGFESLDEITLALAPEVSLPAIDMRIDLN